VEPMRPIRLLGLHQWGLLSIMWSLGDIKENLVGIKWKWEPGAQQVGLGW